MDGMFSAPCSSAAAPRARARARAMRRITGAGFRVRNCARVYLGAGTASGALRGVRVMPSQRDKAMRFRALHETPGTFVIPNVWDGGSASVMAGLGFEALATSSAACAATLGKLDGEVTREEALPHRRRTGPVSPIPVPPDLETGFGTPPGRGAEPSPLPPAPGLGAVRIRTASAVPAPR